MSAIKTLRIHYLQHVSFEDLGCIEDWIISKGHHLTSTRFFENNQLPKISGFDWLIVMGGPMGVNDEEKYNWLSDEKEFIRNAIQAGKIVIGICLGAQLIASVLGARVFPNGEKEIGWFQVTYSDNLLDYNVLGEENNGVPVFHWHGDTFDLPENAIQIASSAACQNQAYLYGNNVLGLQFHLEVTEKSVRQMIAFCGSELVSGRFIQSPEEILGSLQFIGANNQRMIHFLEFFEKR